MQMRRGNLKLSKTIPHSNTTEIPENQNNESHFEKQLHTFCEKVFGVQKIPVLPDNLLY